MKSDNDNLKSVTTELKTNTEEKSEIRIGNNTFERLDVKSNGIIPMKGQQQQQEQEEVDDDVYLSVMRPLQYDETSAFSSYIYRCIRIIDCTAVYYKSILLCIALFCFS